MTDHSHAIDQAADELERLRVARTQNIDAMLAAADALSRLTPLLDSLTAERDALRVTLRKLVDAADDDSADRWERALNAAREQLKC